VPDEVKTGEVTTDASATTDAAAVTATTTTTSPTTLIGGDPAAVTADPVAKGPATWPDNWRDLMAGEDKEFRRQLDRYGSPLDVGQKTRNLEKLVSSGQLKRPLDDKATPEQIAAWRKDNGVPDKPEDYKVELKNGLVLGEADKPIVDEFTKAAHAKNWTPAQVNDALQFYYETQDRLTQQRQAFDAEQMQKAQDALHAEWGPDYRRNINAVDNLLGALPDEIGPLLVNGRLADGTKIGNDPRVMKALRQIAMDLNPAASLVPVGLDSAKGLTDELATIRKFRQENPDKYDQDKAMQARELELLTAQTRMQGRGRAA
jgi:hypothetical protein